MFWSAGNASVPTEQQVMQRQVFIAPSGTLPCRDNPVLRCRLSFLCAEAVRVQTLVSSDVLTHKLFSSFTWKSCPAIYLLWVDVVVFIQSSAIGLVMQKSIEYFLSLKYFSLPCVPRELLLY